MRSSLPYHRLVTVLVGVMTAYPLGRGRSNGVRSSRKTIIWFLWLTLMFGLCGRASLWVVSPLPGARAVVTTLRRANAA